MARNPSLGEQEEAVQAGTVAEGAPTGPNRPRKVRTSATRSRAALAPRGLTRRIPRKNNIAPRSTAWTPPPALEGWP